MLNQNFSDSFFYLKILESFKTIQVSTNGADCVPGSNDDPNSTAIITAAVADRGIIWTTARYAPASTITKKQLCLSRVG